MTNANSLSKLLVLVIGLILAVLMANLLVTDKTIAFAWLGVAAFFITGIALGRDIWMVIPAAFALNLMLRIPGRPDSIILGHAMFVGFSTLLFLMRRLPWRYKFTELDFWALILGLCIAQVYFRNPVGLNILGGDQVGGRPYVIVGITYMSYFVLSNLLVAAEKLKWILRLTIFGGLASFFLNVIGQLVPGIGMWYGAGSGGTESEMAQVEGSTMAEGVGQATRIGFLGHFARNLSLWISTFKNPLTASFHPLWATLIILSLGFAAMSGFRNQIIAVGLTFVFGILYRGGFAHVLIAFTALAVATALLALTNSIIPLPANIQRSLSFLPGTWDADIKRDAVQSTEWRMEIWKEVMLTDRWIKNKWLGDGLGFSAAELAAQQNINARAFSISGLGHHQDAVLANGDYHSGPIQTIRTIGYIGLLFTLFAQIRLAAHAHRLIKRCKNTEWFPLTLIIGIPIVWSPIFFVFVFGTFESAIAGFLLGAGFVKLFQHNLPLAPSRLDNGQFWVAPAQEPQHP
jgi:hypothetical protein